MKRFLMMAGALAVLVGFGLRPAAAGPVGFTFDGTAFYQFGGPADLALGSPSGSPDTGFVQITNSGTTTFTGTIGFNAVTGGGSDQSATYNVTLNPGDHISIAIDDESSNVGGFNGTTGTTQLGAQYEMKGTVSDGVNTENVDLTIYDSDIHSGVSRTNPFGETLDNYILQGGSSVGFDTGDDYETTQASGNFQFFEAAPNAAVVPEPASVTLVGFGAFGLFGYAWRRRAARKVEA